MHIRLARYIDADDIIKFINDNWKENHILARNRKLFLYEFRNGDALNFAIAKNNGYIIGVFGFLKYSNDIKPDIAGSIWTVLKSANIPMLGLRIREFAINNTPHRMFVSPGAGVRTQSIYELLRMNWHKMNHFFILNKNISNYKICRVANKSHKENILVYNREDDLFESNIVIKSIKDSNKVLNYNFNKNKKFYPFKDREYFIKRFIDYPFFSYDIYGAYLKDKVVGLCVCRSVEALGRKAYRIVDFYGDENLLIHFSKYLRNFIIENIYEYLDFVCYGFNDKNLLNSGFNRLKMDESDVVIPSHFSPFQRENVQIYAVSDKANNLRVRICKADGDQDRPNL